MKVEFTIPGKPEGKGRPRFSTRGKFVKTYTPDNTVIYENWVRECWQNAKAPKLQGELWAFITAFFPIPKSTGKKARADMAGHKVGCAKKPDADNIAKCVLDALNGIAYDDDSQITYLAVNKLYSDDPRCVVLLRERPPKEET